MLKRFDIANVLKDISIKQGRFNDLVFPDLQFSHSARIGGSEGEKGRCPEETGELTTVEAEDLALFNEYARKAVEKETNIALCREYKSEMTVSEKRTKMFRAMVGRCRKEYSNCPSSKRIYDQNR